MYLNIENFQREIDWYRTHIYEKFGKLATRVEMDTNAERWLFYNEDNELITIVPHAVVEKLYEIFFLRAPIEPTKSEAEAKTKKPRPPR